MAEVVADLNAGGYQVEVNAVGPYGPLPAVKFPINVQDLRYNLAAPPGTLNGVVVALEKATEKIVGAIAASRAVRRDEPPTGL